MTDNTGRDHVRVEDAHHSMPLLRLPAGLFEGIVQPKRSTIQNLPVGFQADGLLTASECAGLVSLAESNGLKSISWEYDPGYRSCTRLVARMPELAAELWRRIRPLLRMSDIAEARPFGYGVSSTDIWRPYSINECIRAIIFTPVARHRDGAFVITDEHRSVHTIMVYLNEKGAYMGGETVFYVPNPAGTSDTDMLEVAKNRGSVGSGLVFQHQIWHEGRPLGRGVKYILRTDMMFVRVATAAFSKSLRFADEPKYHEAEALYQKSIKLQNEGDPAGSTEAYRGALEMHATLEVTSTTYGPEYSTLPIDVMSEIFGMLPLGDILKRVWCVSRGWRALAKHPTLWKRFYIKHIGGWASTDKKLVVCQLPQRTPLKDWYTLYRTHSKAKREFKVVYVDLGSVYMRYGMLGQKQITYDGTVEHQEVVPSLIMKIKGHYWGAQQGLSQHQCGWEAFRRSYLAAHSSVITPFNVARASIQVLLRWMLLSGFDRRLMPSEHPLLLARPPEFTDADCTYIGDVMRTLVGVPCVSFVDPAVCTLASIDCHSGLVISLSRYSFAITAVHDAQVVASVHERYHQPLTSHYRTVNQTWDSPLTGFVWPANAKEIISHWCQACNGMLEPMLQRVVKQMAVLPEDVIVQIWHNTVLRGAYADQVAAKWLEVVKTLSAGKVQKFTPVSGNDITEPKEKMNAPLATMDVFTGLQKLCSSVSTAQRFFASVAPAVLRFNRTILLLLEIHETYTNDSVWNKLQGWHYKTRETYDENKLTQKQVKIFKSGTELRDWWQAFEPQLQVAVRKGLVRCALNYAGGGEKVSLAAIYALFDWRKSLGVNEKELPVLLWLSGSTIAKELLTDMANGVFVHREWSTDPWHAFALSTPPSHQNWKNSTQQIANGTFKDEFSYEPDPRGP